MIDVVGVTKSYRVERAYRTVLENVSVHLGRDDRLGVLGAGGAGKSTLIRLIAGAEAVDEGVIRTDGRISWPLGFSGGLHPGLSGDENARVIARLYSVDGDELSAYCHHFSELGDDFYAPVSVYSGGMKGRLSFALSMGVPFDCYIADEVTGMGDSQFKEKCAVALEEKLRNTALFLVSKNTRTVDRFCNRFGVLESGQLFVFDSLEQAEARFNLVQG